tara:strand:+ start:591 stop:1007 length:417 start_codon:yes stop_codon:yes gene_type:complete
MSSTTQQILNIIDENKEKISDGVYKEICDKLAELNKVPHDYVRLTGIGTKIVTFDDEEKGRRMDRNEFDEYDFWHGTKSIILQVVERIGTEYEGVNMNKSIITKGKYDDIKTQIAKYDYYCLGQADKKFFVTKMEQLK